MKELKTTELQHSRRLDGHWGGAGSCVASASNCWSTVHHSPEILHLCQEIQGTQTP